MFIDTHCHLDLVANITEHEPLNSNNIKEIQNIIDESIDQKVTTVITIGTNIDSSKKSVHIASQIPSVYATIGVHPCDTVPQINETLAELHQLLSDSKSSKIVGIGEVGLDYYHPGFITTQQQEYFRRQIELSIEHNLPLVIHSRNAFTDTISILDEYRDQKPRGVFHCFSEDLAAAEKVIERGFLVGVDGHISYPKNHNLREAITFCGIENLLLETDAPFLSPQKVRGTRNHPRNIPLIAEYLAENLFTSLSIEEIGQKTSQNALKLFKKIR